MHPAVIIGTMISFALMIALSIFEIDTIWSYASNIIVIEQFILFCFFIFYKSDILMEISYPICIWIQTVSLFIIKFSLDTDKVILTHYIALSMITIWSLRLSIYLSLRISLKKRQNEQYSRFNNLWENKLRLFLYLVFQYLTIFVNNLSVIAIFYFDTNSIYRMNENKTNDSILWLNIMCIILFVFGITISSIADYHKYKLQNNDIDACNIYKYSFLWRICRRINYNGDMIIFWSIWRYSVNVWL